MKKLIALLMILAMVPAAAMGDRHVFSNVTDEYLAEVNEAVQQELFKRAAVQGVTVPAGQYTVGVDMPAGIYRVVLSSNDSFAVCAFSIIFENPEDGNAFGSFILTPENNTVGKIEIYDKQTVYLNYPLTFYTYTGLFN